MIMGMLKRSFRNMSEMESFLNISELYDLIRYNILRLSSKTEIILNR